MTLASSRLRHLHGYLADHMLYPIVLSSILALGIFAGRVYLSDNGTYGFLIWNLILAWIPYACSLWADAVQRRYPWWGLLIPGLTWLLFFPNAPYLVTDLMHLDARWPVPLWYDVVMLATFAWTGCFLAVASLRTMQALVASYLGRWIGWVFVMVTLGLTGFGIYLGRFLNWNSWDIFIRPRSLLSDVLHRVANPLEYLGAYGVTFLFAAFLFVCYVTFLSVHRRERI